MKKRNQAEVEKSLRKLLGENREAGVRTMIEEISSSVINQPQESIKQKVIILYLF